MKKLKSKGGTIVTRMPLERFLLLKDHTINSAIDAGLIEKIGDDEGNFIVNSKTADGRKYAIVNGQAILCSPALSDADGDDIENSMGDLRFSATPSEKKYNIRNEEDENGEHILTMRLTMPAGLNLDYEDAIKASFEEEPKPAKPARK